ncbi:MAG: FAD-binding protein, partial [Ruminococcaceae bacterium]|nr:FAD-binding protein [Oscillospiraceae bacterium]
MENKLNKTKECDLAVIGAGPAGLMAGFAAASRGLRVVIIEKMNAPGRKLLITGKGRCNVTNECGTEEFLGNIRNGARFMYSSLYAFDSFAVMEFFETHGVPLKTERGNRVFPQSDCAADIRDALVGAAKKAGCRFISGRAVKVETDESGVNAVILEDKTRVSCRAAVIATGGLSYPKTGSTGDGYSL